MTLKIQCPNCASVRSVNPRVMGREIRCPDCDRLFLVEPNTQVSASTPTDNEDALSDSTDDNFPGDLPEEFSPTDAVMVERARPAAPTTSSIHAEEELEEVVFAAKELPKDDMDMTPMVDVTFLLLIFFMITASFASEKVFEKPPPMLEMPSNKPPENPPEVYDSVRVQIDEFNAYTIIFPTGDEREASSKQDLLMALGDARAEVSTGKDDETLKLIVEAHEECIHAAIVAALDAGREKGFTSFTISVVEEFE